MFGGLRPAQYGSTDAESNAKLHLLGTKMEVLPGSDHAKDGADGEESAIPALYTYLGQFIDHDLTFGPEGSFQKQRDPEALTDFRTPAFDLDCVYGRGPTDQPYLYDGDSFLLGDEIHGAVDTKARDLPRNRAEPARALIGDPRNDENVIVSQFHGLFLRFHNRLVATGASFSKAQHELQRHYQYVVLHDFLPRIVSERVLDKLKVDGHFDASKIEHYKPKRGPFIPIEFSTAAYRFGHSMIRPGYRLNDDDATLLDIFGATAAKDLRGKHAMDPGRGIDWGRFIDIDTRPYDGDDGTAAQKGRLQFAYRIDTSLVGLLAQLPGNVATGDQSLASRNLRRGFSLGLPSGQAVANAMKLTPMKDKDILIGKALDKLGEADTPPVPITEIDEVFTNNCPLWTYVLAEAMHHKAKIAPHGSGAPATVTTPQLGPVGGRIVAECFLGMMYGDRSSLLRTHPHWKPEGNANYGLKDFVAFALG